MFRNRKDYLKQYGAKTTIVSEIFKENEMKGTKPDETEIELLREKIVRSRMLTHYRRLYNNTKSQIGWM